ncbi:MBL fold metallo-hydrolase [Tundrisphaera lichenicola]|uniref:MBL fold metallo-hydrolase n=1 Tax=Tundrisphaera lichenicola TaxID=2029860 RepID=UPI003EB7CA64
MPIQFAVLASGSRGNSALVQSGHAGLLIDFGLGPRALSSRLDAVGSGLDRISAAILTHTHGDHANPTAIGMLFARKIPLYCHEGHRRVLGSRPGFEALDAAGLVRHYDDRPFLGPGGLRIEPVTLSHDGGPTFGFRVEGRPERGSKSVAVGYLADTGCWSEAMADAMADVEALGVEFNHDVELQRGSGRGYHLIARNLGDRGHLSNAQGAGLVSAILDRSSPGRIRDLVLLHLSDQCNRPELAIREARGAIRRSGRRVAVHAALQSEAYPNLQVRPGVRRRVVPRAAFPWEAA